MQPRGRKTSLGPRGLAGPGGGGRRGGGGGGGFRHGGGGHHHHGGGGRWGGGPPGWWGYGYPYPGTTDVFLVDDAPRGPLYASCPCPCRCHDDPGRTTHTVPVRENQACCRCPFMPRAQALRAHARGALHGLGDVAAPAPPNVASIKALQKQINRYAGPVGSVPDGIRFLNAKIPVDGVLTHQVAQVAAMILAKRASDAYDTFGPAERPGGPYYTLLQKARLAVVAPLPMIISDINGATQILSLYGDMRGLPPAPSTIVEAVSDPRVLGAGAVAAILWFMTRRG